MTLAVNVTDWPTAVELGDGVKVVVVTSAFTVRVAVADAEPVLKVPPVLVVYFAEIA